MRYEFLSFVKSIVVTLLFLLLISCISYRPIFVPNAKFKAVGEQVANKDADQCYDEAGKYLKASKKRRVVKEGARGIGVGAIFGMVWGVFTGNTDDIIRSTVIGSGIGGASRAGGVMAEDKLTPDQIKQRYISICLGEKGYRILGWE